MESSAQGVYTVSGHLREEAAVKAELEKSNFDLKMRVFYLEEKLTRLAGSEGTAGLFGSGGDDGNSAMNALRLQVEEKNLELEQRNVLLTKAKTAIEALKREIERNKAEHSRQQDLEDRVRRLKQASDEMEAEFQQQTAQLEGQLQQSRQACLVKDQATAELESKVSALELGLQQCRERAARLAARAPPGLLLLRSQRRLALRIRLVGEAPREHALHLHHGGAERGRLEASGRHGSQQALIVDWRKRVAGRAAGRRKLVASHDGRALWQRLRAAQDSQLGALRHDCARADRSNAK
jgi:hypothetical protein